MIHQILPSMFISIILTMLDLKSSEEIRIESDAIALFKTQLRQNLVFSLIPKKRENIIYEHRESIWIPKVFCYIVFMCNYTKGYHVIFFSDFMLNIEKQMHKMCVPFVQHDFLRLCRKENIYFILNTFRSKLYM